MVPVLPGFEFRALPRLARTRIKLGHKVSVLGWQPDLSANRFVMPTHLFVSHQHF